MTTAEIVKQNNEILIATTKCNLLEAAYLNLQSIAYYDQAAKESDEALAKYEERLTKLSEKLAESKKELIKVAGLTAEFQEEI